MITVEVRVENTRKYKFKDEFGVQSMIAYLQAYGHIPTHDENFIDSILYDDGESISGSHFEVSKDDKFITTVEIDY